MSDGPAVLDPLALSEELAATYRRYLRSTFAPRDPVFRQALADALEHRFDVSRGPFLQAAAPYAPGATVRQLVEEGVLAQAFLRMTPDAFPVDRPLYLHQEQAVRKISGGRNLIVATGTGSGKTECFLLPILDHLHREAEAGTLGQAGVRALLLYPMNALANDQMRRLRELFAPFPAMTFGRYIGDTARSHKQALQTFRSRFGADPPSNEFISREEMQERPPHVLLTNYAMLEYLLLRPRDSSFFDGETGRHWRYVVLDEVHVYDGAKGAELGMLIRRVRDRVHRSEKGRLRCIATSATLGKDPADLPRLTAFATALFDEQFTWGPDGEHDIIEPTRLPLASAGAEWSLAEDRVETLRDEFRSGAGTEALARVIADQLPSGEAPPQGEEPAAYLARVLARETHVVSLQRRLQEGSVDLATISRELFTGPAAGRCLVALVDLCVAARTTEHDAPLLPARYHFMLRALEGGFVCLHPGHPEQDPRLLLARHDACPACERAGAGGAMFELGVCRRCGAGYLVGVPEDGDDGMTRLATAPLFQDRLSYLLVDATPLEAEDEDESAVISDEESATDLDRMVVCTSCRALGEGDQPGCSCGAGSVRSVTAARPAKTGEVVRRCPACSGRSNTAIVARFLTGADAPVAVIATGLYQGLPPSADRRQQARTGAGRKLLSFSDSRQDAAFFAPYLDRTYSRAVERRLIWEVLRDRGADRPRLGDLEVPLRRAAEDALVLDEDAGTAANADRVRTWLMREVLGVDRRQSLEGTALAEVTVALPRGLAAPRRLTEMGFSEDECFDLARILLDTVRASAAVHIPPGVDIKDPIFAPRNAVTTMRGEGSERGVLAWLPSRGLNRRVDFVERLLRRRSISVDARELLGELWLRWFADSTGPWATTLVAKQDRQRGTVFALDPGRFEFLPAGDGHLPTRCDTCRQVWWRSLDCTCPSYRCEGNLVPLPADDGDSHYRRLYTSLAPIGIRVEEHTAQLEAEWAGKLQQEFIDGAVNVLSCSTTFELGVDLGEVQAVLCRNVPPSPANYVQRAGRAGRRSGAAALVVTYAQRRNHDRHFFEHPHALVDGVVSAPVVRIDNPAIVRRHLHAVAFAAFERRLVDAGGEAHQNVESFFLEPSASPGSKAPVDEFVGWLQARPGELGDPLLRIAPPEVQDELGVGDWSWVDALTVPDDTTGFGWLTRARNEARDDLSDVTQQIADAVEAEHYPYAGVLKRVRSTLALRSVFDFLAQRTVLPKYGFPVDVVNLDVSKDSVEGARLDLNRDLQLAIVDYAPGAKVVAAKALWEPTGLRIPAGRALLRYGWAICGTCGAFRSRRGDSVEEICACGSHADRRKGHYVAPIFGFVGRRSSDEPGEERPRRAGTGDRYFSDFAGPEPEPMVVPVGAGHVECRQSRQGQITVLNRGPGGRGFRQCFSCGFAEQAPLGGGGRPKPHRMPNNRKKECGGRLEYVQLGHRYLTDVVELRLGPGLDVDAALSTLYALLAATHAVGIVPTDVDGTLRYLGASSPALVLFDAVPGGAGHAMRLSERLSDLFRGALAVAANCECGEDTSCYGCLRSYSNQRDHDRLRRGEAARALRAVLGQ